MKSAASLAIKSAIPSRRSIESIDEQTKRLRKLFPQMGFAPVKPAYKVGQQHVDGHLVLLPYTVVHKTYLQALEILASMLREHRGIAVDMACDGKIQERRFRRAQDVGCVHTQKKQFVVIPVHFFRFFLGFDPALRIPGIVRNEFSLDTFSILLSLLTCDSLWEFSKVHALVGGDKDHVAYLQCVHGGAAYAWHNSSEFFEVSPFVFESTISRFSVFPAGACISE